MIDLFKALLTPTIGAIAVYIAWQQWKINDQKLNLELYDRRLKIYKEVKRYLSSVARKARTNPQDVLSFYASVSEADFLFDNDIPDYIEEIFRHANNLSRWNAEYRDASSQPWPDDYDHHNVVENMHAELKWLVEQFEPARNKFQKYLQIRK